MTKEEFRILVYQLTTKFSVTVHEGNVRTELIIIGDARKFNWFIFGMLKKVGLDISTRNDNPSDAVFSFECDDDSLVLRISIINHFIKA